MKLSNNFSLEEFTLSQTAERFNIHNVPSIAHMHSLVYTAEQLELVRTLLSSPILISSGYRCRLLNKLVGGSPSSQHTLGEAVDFTSPSYGTPKEIVKAIVASEIAYDQVILEFGKWVHISFVQGTNRKQALVIDSIGTRIFS